MSLLICTPIANKRRRQCSIECFLPVPDLCKICASYVTNPLLEFEELVTRRIWSKTLSKANIDALAASKQDYVVEYLSLFASSFVHQEDRALDYDYMFQTRMQAKWTIGLCERLTCIYSIQHAKCTCGSPLIRSGT